MIFLIDFDKTISQTCTCATMIEQFATADTAELDRQWEEGILTTPQAFDKLITYLSMDERQLIDAMKQIEIDPFFETFITYCKQHNHQYAVVSDGFDFTISSILNKYFDEPFVIYANHLHFKNGQWHTSYPYRSDASPNLGVSKSTIVKKYQQQGKVAFIGDGYTDYQASEVSDHVFAKDKLALYCQAKDIPYFNYTDFNDILTALQTFDGNDDSSVCSNDNIKREQVL